MPLIGHIKGCTDYPGPEDEDVVVAGTWEYILSPRKSIMEGATFYSQLTRAADEILLRHKIRNMVLQACEGDDDAFRFLKNAYGKKIRDFIQYKHHIVEAETLDSLENDTWMYCFKKIDSPEEGQSYNPAKGAFITWIRILANILAKRLKTQMYKLHNREIMASSLGNEEDPIELESIQPYEDSQVATFSLIHDPAKQFVDRFNLLHIYRELLCTVFCCGAKPHQLISFVYQKLLEWKPQKVVDLLSDKILWDSGVQGYQDYASCFSDEEDGLSEGIVDDSFSQFFLQLKKLFEEIYREREYDPLRNTWSGVTTGLTKLEIYFGTDRPKSVTQWTFKLKERVRKSVSIEPSACFSS